MRTHAEHIGNWDAAHAGQYFYLSVVPLMGPEASVLRLNTVFPNASVDVTSVLVKPFLDDVLALGTDILAEGTASAALPGAILGLLDDVGGTGTLMASRLIPVDVYASKEGRTEVEKVYVELLAMGVPRNRILGNLITGGKVAENMHVDSVIHPGQRTAKTHMIAVQDLPKMFTLSELEAVESMVTHGAVPILAWLTASASVDGEHPLMIVHPTVLVVPSECTLFEVYLPSSKHSTSAAQKGNLRIMHVLSPHSSQTPTKTHELEAAD
ncbi:hypothetical protein OF83DRAFT_1179639 [Amylostereum chailletii]|nr:hypothetical protein OF83DRAFT_1179639 [Amylostereum chailletii]